MSEFENKPNEFVRALIIMFCCGLAFMVGYNFLFVEPVGEINSSAITLLVIMLVLVLSESFDNFSVGKLFSISREVKKKEQKVQKLEKEKSDLFNQLMTIANTQNQTQQHTTITGDYYAGVPAVEKASQEEIAEIKDTQDDCFSGKKDISLKHLKHIALAKYIKKQNLNTANVIFDAKLVKEFHGTDQIGNLNLIFDAYYKEDKTEVFCHCRRASSIGITTRDRVYIFLSKLYHYKKLKKVDVRFDFILIETPDIESISPKLVSRYVNDFTPSIASGLLFIDDVEVTQEEIDAFLADHE
ncbi:hypothetical protein [Maridesulfovibrio sp.]|uniref:hypothetical protein n=1 Tax=Maridesulfovibrio sp. TaxID=2795000 RepID=UPI0029F4FDF8|nr:hypothetical protein [Maridesulfovibrio sp.]